MTDDGHNYFFGQWPEMPWKVSVDYSLQLQSKLKELTSESWKVELKGHTYICTRLKDGIEAVMSDRFITGNDDSIRHTAVIARTKVENAARYATLLNRRKHSG